MVDINRLLDEAVESAVAEGIEPDEEAAADAGDTVATAVDDTATAADTVATATGATPPPYTGTTAEVVALVTSLGAGRKQFFGSKRAMHLLDCKGVAYYSIDANKDVGSDRLDNALIQSWGEAQILQNDGNTILIPQVLIDGVSIGGWSDLQDLEEDGDLDWILARALCPNCLVEKSPNAESCATCGVLFQELIPIEAVEQKLVLRWQRGEPLNHTLEPPQEKEDLLFQV